MIKMYFRFCIIGRYFNKHILYIHENIKNKNKNRIEYVNKL